MLLIDNSDTYISRIICPISAMKSGCFSLMAQSGRAAEKK